MKSIALLFLLAGSLSFVVAGTADAKGRTGSHRSGGYNSHGKGSHYYGGHTMLMKDGNVVVAGSRCRDGSYSQSTGSGTCSHHGGEG